MYVYKLTFDNGANFQIHADSLSAAHEKIVPYMMTHNLNMCSIKCHNGVVRTVQKTGAYHWKHDGYAFS